MRFDLSWQNKKKWGFSIIIRNACPSLATHLVAFVWRLAILENIGNSFLVFPTHMIWKEGARLRNQGEFVSYPIPPKPYHFGMGNLVKITKCPARRSQSILDSSPLPCQESVCLLVIFDLIVPACTVIFSRLWAQSKGRILVGSWSILRGKGWWTNSKNGGLKRKIMVFQQMNTAIVLRESHEIWRSIYCLFQFYLE